MKQVSTLKTLVLDESTQSYYNSLKSRNVTAILSESIKLHRLGADNSVISKINPNMANRKHKSAKKALKITLVNANNPKLNPFIKGVEGPLQVSPRVTTSPECCMHDYFKFNEPKNETRNIMHNNNYAKSNTTLGTSRTAETERSQQETLSKVGNYYASTDRIKFNKFVKSGYDYSKRATRSQGASKNASSKDILQTNRENVMSPLIMNSLLRTSNTTALNITKRIPMLANLSMNEPPKDLKQFGQLKKILKTKAPLTSTQKLGLSSIIKSYADDKDSKIKTEGSKLKDNLEEVYDRVSNIKKFTLEDTKQAYQTTDSTAINEGIKSKKFVRVLRKIKEELVSTERETEYYAGMIPEIITSTSKNIKRVNTTFTPVTNDTLLELEPKLKTPLAKKERKISVDKQIPGSLLSSADKNISRNIKLTMNKVTDYIDELSSTRMKDAGFMKSSLTKDSKKLFDLIKQENINKILDLLKSNSAIVNDKDNLSQTPLHVAVKRGNIAIVDILLAFGANLNELDLFKRDVKAIAKDKGFYHILQMLNEKEKNLYIADLSKYEDLIKS